MLTTGFPCHEVCPTHVSLVHSALTTATTESLSPRDSPSRNLSSCDVSHHRVKVFILGPLKTQNLARWGCHSDC